MGAERWIMAVYEDEQRTAVIHALQKRGNAQLIQLLLSLLPSIVHPFEILIFPACVCSPVHLLKWYACTLMVIA